MINKFKIWLNIKEVKRALTIVIPIIITLVSGLISTFTSLSQFYFAILCCLCIIYYFLCNYYEKNEDNKDSKIESLNNELIVTKKKENNYYKNLEMSNKIISFCDTYLSKVSEGVSKTADGINQDGIVLIKLFETDTFCQEICENLHKFLIEKLDVDSDNLSVSFTRTYQKEDDLKRKKRYIYMAAHSKKSNRPDYYRKEKCLATQMKGYYISKYINKDKKNIEIYLTNKEINMLFKNHPAEKPSKYSQYIIYPITCEKNQLLGILQLICYNDAKFGYDKNKVEKEIQKDLMLYSSLILLIYKIKKGLIAAPRDGDKI